MSLIYTTGFGGPLKIRKNSLNDAGDGSLRAISNAGNGSWQQAYTFFCIRAASSGFAERAGAIDADAD
jgi:hypothetical protein